jgi:hypothetical protein
MKWFADNSELHGTKDSVIPDILIFGGLIIEPTQETSLKKSVEQIKKKYCGYDRAPIKWNMRDLENLYKSQNMEDLYRDLFAKSQDWRMEIFDQIANTECSVLVSCLEGYSADRAVLKDKKDDLTGMVFSNALMRYALHVQEKKPQSAGIVLDWPDKGKPATFDREYASAYSRGHTADKSVKYTSGALESLNFSDSAYYANMNHSTMLQIADLVVGATREFLDHCIKDKKATQGVTCTKQIASRFRGAPAKIFGRGIIVPSGNDQLSTRVKNGIKSHLCAT